MKNEIIKSKKYIPWVLRRSRDMQALCKIIDLLINSSKTTSDNFINYLDFDNCPDNLLPFLASYVGYDYDYKESIKSNKTIIKNYPNLIHNRGSEVGIALAVALSVNTLEDKEQVDSLNLFNIDYQPKNNKIVVYIYVPNNTAKTRELLEVVRPAGTKLEIVPASLISTLDGVEIADFVHPTKYMYDKTRYGVGGDNQVGFSEVTNKEKK